MNGYAVLLDSGQSMIVCCAAPTYADALAYVFEMTHGRPMNGYRICQVRSMIGQRKISRRLSRRRQQMKGLKISAIVCGKCGSEHFDLSERKCLGCGMAITDDMVENLLKQAYEDYVNAPEESEGE